MFLNSIWFCSKQKKVKHKKRTENKTKKMKHKSKQQEKCLQKNTKSCKRY